MEIEKIFPHIGQDIEGARYVYDRDMVKMGFVADDIFWLRADYEHWASALERLIENDVKVMRWEESA